MLIPVEEHNQMLRDYMAIAEKTDRPQRDNCRVVVSGMFCEQPPLNLIKSIELAGCYVIDDDFMLVNRWLTEDVPLDGDPIENLARTFIHHLSRHPQLSNRMKRKGPVPRGCCTAQPREGVILPRRVSVIRRCSNGQCCRML
jgi:bcr-type benzoyl-CoA reductase subunit C